jgi:hypothetical protein
MTELTQNNEQIFKNFTLGGDQLLGNKEYIKGKGNSLCYKTLGDNTQSDLVSLWNSLKRNTPSDIITNLIDKLMKDENVYTCNLIFKMLMQSRDCRGGKGEKEVTYNGLLQMNKYLPKTTEIFITKGLLEYGYAKDLIIIWDRIYGNSEYENLANKILNFVAEGINNGNPYIVKYAPRENKKYKKMVDNLIKIIYPELVSYEGIRKAISENSNSNYTKKEIIKIQWNCAKRRYRVLLAQKNDVVETKMCKKIWSEIEVDKIPSKAFQIYGCAFLDEKVNGERRHKETDFEYYDRDICRNNTIKKLCDPNVIFNGARASIELLVKELFNNEVSSMRKLQINKIVESIVKDLKKQIQDLEQQLKEKDPDNYKPFKPCIPLCDVSGSMTGTPMFVCIGLGIILSSFLQENEFLRNKVITFETNPRWITLSGKDFCSMVNELKTAPWGGSTNFESVNKLVLDIAKKNNLKKEEIPDLVIFSDMQFDQANHHSPYSCYNQKNEDYSWKTHHELICDMWKKNGYENPPNMIYWDLAGCNLDANGFPVLSDTEGTTLVSGFNPSLMKLFLTGQPLFIEEEVVDEKTGTTIKVSKKLTPWDSFLKAMSDKKYNLVELLILQANEKWMKDLELSFE